MKRFVISTLLLLSILSIDIHAQRAPEFSKPPNNGDVYVVAHRGAHQGIPENSLPAYQKAIDLGADFVEIDVRTTKDGELVSIHNGTVDAYGEGFSGEVAEMTGFSSLTSFTRAFRRMYDLTPSAYRKRSKVEV